jgi:hypothetical protein
VFLLLAIACNYPGRLNIDSVEQLSGAADIGSLTNWHSPLVTWLWSLPSAWIGQPAGALLVQSALFAFYAAVRPARIAWSPFSGAYLIVELLFKLVLIAWCGVILKDVLLTGVTLALIGAFQLARSGQHSVKWFVACAFLLLVAAFVRPTNFLILLVLAAFLLLFLVRTRRSYWGALAGAAAVSLALLPANQVLNRLVGAWETYPEQQLLLFDLGGISATTGNNLFAQIPGWPSNLPPPRDCYTPRLWDNFAPWGRCSGYSAAYVQSRARGGFSPTAWVWARGVASHPVAYLRHRGLHTFHTLEAFPQRPSGIFRADDPRSQWTPVNSKPRQAQLARRLVELKADPGLFSLWRENITIQPFTRLSHLLLGRFFAPAAALAVCLTMMGVALARLRRGRRIDPAIVLAAGIGLGNTAMIFAFGVAASARYLLPLMFCTAAGALIVLHNWSNSAGARRWEKRHLRGMLRSGRVEALVFGRGGLQASSENRK